MHARSKGALPLRLDRYLSRLSLVLLSFEGICDHACFVERYFIRLNFQSIKEQCFIELREYLTRVYIVCSALLSVRSFLCFLVWYLCTPYTMDAVLRPFLRSFSLSLLPIHLFLSSSISHSSWRCCCFVSFSQAIRIRAFSRNQFPAVSIQFLVYIRSVQCV